MNNYAIGYIGTATFKQYYYGTNITEVARLVKEKKKSEKYQDATVSIRYFSDRTSMERYVKMKEPVGIPFINIDLHSEAV